MKRNNNAVPCGSPDTPIPENLLYTREQLEKGMKPGSRPVIPAWHLVEGVIKLTYWHAIKYYSKVIIAAEKARLECTQEQAKEWVEGYHDFRNRRLEDVLKYLLDAYPPFIEGEKALPQHRQWMMVRNRTSECPQPPTEEVKEIKPYVMKPGDWYLKKSAMIAIYEGEPEPFFEFLRHEVKELAEAFEHFKTAMSSGHGKTLRELESFSNTVKMMHNDIADFLAKYN